MSASSQPRSSPSFVLVRALGLGLGLSTLVSVACSGKDPTNPGTQLGTFHVSAALQRSTCGATPNPWEFDVRLNHDGTVLYWIQGAAPTAGDVDKTATTKLKTEAVYEVRAADAKKKKAVCALSRQDSVTMTLAAADNTPAVDPSNTTSFTGELVYSFTPTEGSDCSDQVVGSGGGFEALPCEVAYAITGTFKSPPYKTSK